MKQELCSECKETKTFRKCSECKNKPLCIICEIKHEHQSVVIIKSEILK